MRIRQKTRTLRAFLVNNTRKAVDCNLSETWTGAILVKALQVRRLGCTADYLYMIVLKTPEENKVKKKVKKEVKRMMMMRGVGSRK